jgi:hypothetical protein
MRDVINYWHHVQHVPGRKAVQHLPTADGTQQQKFAASSAQQIGTNGEFC